ncbi:MAG: GRAM domain-containing protein [Bacteroidales bacterium]|nr:GRAM domain-containing protein [Bacteroidales bacterium]
MMRLQLQPNEQVIKAGDSNHVSEAKTVDGKLILTNQKRVYFKPTEIGYDSFDLQLEANQIRDVMYFKSGLFSKGLRLITQEGEDLRFKVKGCESWAKALSKII